MKSVLISIQPKWCELIASGKKTVEVRKTKPKLETPFKVYIYCTKDKPTFTQSAFCESISNGKVIGEFVCNRIDYWQYDWRPDVMHIEDMSELSCVSVEDLLNYSNKAKDTLYGWHISDLVIYDKPRKLSEFKQVKKIRGYHKKDEPKTEGINIQALLHSSRVEVKYLTRPPQSWCYVEEQK